MRRTLLALGVIVFPGCGLAPGPDAVLDLAAAEARVRGESPGSDQLATMTRVLQLDAASKESLRQAFTTRDTEVESWLKGPDGTRLVELEAQMHAGMKVKDLVAVESATRQAAPLRNALRKLIADHDTAIMNTLNPEQRNQWDGHLVADKLLTLMQPRNLSAAQSQAIQQGGPAAVRQAIQAGQPNPKAAAFLELEKWAEGSVLSPEQRTAYEDIKTKNKLRSLSF